VSTVQIIVGGGVVSLFETQYTQQRYSIKKRPSILTWSL